MTGRQEILRDAQDKANETGEVQFVYRTEGPKHRYEKLVRKVIPKKEAVCP